MAFLALALQVVVPAGFMVANKSQDQLFAITLCTSSGNVAAFLNQDGAIVQAPQPGNLPDDGDHERRSPCAFVGHGVAFVAPMLVPAGKPNAVKQAPATALSYIAPGIGLAAPPPPKTGPPIQV